MGSWPELKSIDASQDTSGDGMPDEWKKEMGLDINVREANGKDLSAAYDNIEVYINSLVSSITANQM